MLLKLLYASDSSIGPFKKNTTLRDFNSVSLGCGPKIYIFNVILITQSGLRMTVVKLATQKHLFSQLKQTNKQTRNH